LTIGRFTQKQLSEKAGITPQHVSKILKRQVRVSSSCLYKLAKALSVSAGYFFEGISCGTNGHDESPSLGFLERDRTTLAFFEIWPKLNQKERKVLHNVAQMLASASLRSKSTSAVPLIQTALADPCEPLQSAQRHVARTTSTGSARIAVSGSMSSQRSKRC
jgi:transcriptional regulator with XRE-family HTH domain